MLARTSELLSSLRASHHYLTALPTENVALWNSTMTHVNMCKVHVHGFIHVPMAVHGTCAPFCRLHLFCLQSGMVHLTCKCTEYQCSSNSGCYVITGALVQKAAITGALVQKAAITGALVQ